MNRKKRFFCKELGLRIVGIPPSVGYCPTLEQSSIGLSAAVEFKVW